MSRTQTITKLPVAEFARLLGIHPLHFEQVTIPTISPRICNDVYFQHPWQNSDHTSREEVAQAIAEAEANLERALKYRLCPTWEVDEWHTTHRHFRPEITNFSTTDIRGYRQTVRADWGYLLSGGIRSQVSVSPGEVIVWSDEDGDGLDDTGTVSASTNTVDPDEIKLYYPGKAGDDAWEIRPINVSITGLVATITFKRELAIQPRFFDIYDTSEDASADYTDDDDFLETVDVYRRYNDPQSQVSLLWEPYASNCGSCSGTGCGSCAYSTQTGCLTLRSDPRNSIVGYFPADWNPETFVFDAASWAIGRQPDLVRLYYYAGWRDKSQRLPNQLSPEWQRTIAYYAAALLDRPPCDCSADVWRYWREDLTTVAGDEDGKAFFRSPDGNLDNPFGSRRGMLNAWRKVIGNTGAEQIAQAVNL